MNVLTPVLVRKRFAPNRTGAMMGLYAMLMGASAALTAAVTVPLYHASGSWQITLGIAIIPAVLGTAPLVAMLILLLANAALSPRAGRGTMLARPRVP